MFEHTFHADWRHASIPAALTIIVVGAALAFAFQ
jgi:hypothetical protein